MKRFCKKLALLLAILTVLAVCASALTACQDPGKDEETGTQAPESGTGTTDKGQSITHTITVKSAGGMALDKINVYIYTDDTLEDLVNYTTTNAEGVGTIALPAGNKYVAVLSGLPEGYKPEASYPLTGATTEIAVTSGVITDSTDLSGVSYQLGSVMRDFTVVDTDGTTHKLSELLKVKKVVMLNFWATWCGPCQEEFPGMNAAYESYKDQVEILALDPDQDSSETEEAIAAYKASMGISFPMLKDRTALSTAFALTGYPTTVIIDRYGVVCFMYAGAIPSDSYFNAIFNYYSATDYEQKLVTDLTELLPREKPNVDMPSSDEIKNAFGGQVNATFAPETNPDDAEYSWPFIIGEKDGSTCLIPSNSNKHSSYATMYMELPLKKGEAVAFDYWASSEIGSDVLFLLAKRADINKDTYKDIYQISGVDSKWNTCYTFVADADGTYSIGFCYIKDTTASEGDDKVYLKNLRVVKESEISAPTYIPRYAATQLKADGSGYEQYATVVFNETDGLYHVGTKDGPLLLADLMKPTRFSQSAIYTFALEGKITLNGKDYLEDIVTYASYASNSAISGLCPVNEELKELLVITANALGLETDNENQWLQICCYYDAYGTGGAQLADPTKGLYTTDADNLAIIDPQKAFTATLGENSLVYDRLIMPRGLIARFIPEQSGVYRITSKGDVMVEGWIFDENGHEYYLYEGGERLYADPNNVSMVVYLEAGKSYYIDICYYDVYATGTVFYDIEHIGATYDHFTIASPGYFTFPEGSEDGTNLGDLAEILAGGINVKLGDDGFYHELREDGSLGSILYVDVVSTSSVFGSDSLESLIAKGAFDFTKSESDELILDYIEKHGDNTKTYLKDLWGDQYADLAAAHRLDDVLAGKLHGSSSDKAALAREHFAKKLTAADGAELEGCVPVDAELGALLQELMDKYTFQGVDHSWTKLCYYYQQLGK